MPRFFLLCRMLVTLLLMDGAGGLFCTRAQAFECLPPEVGLRLWLPGDKQLRNQVSGEAAVPPGALSVPGKAGDGYRFLDSSHVIEAQLHGMQLANNFTFECWLRLLPRGTATGGLVDSWGTIASVRGRFWFKVGPAGELMYFDSGKGELSTGPVLTTGVWQHVAVVVKEESAELYVDGELLIDKVLGASGAINAHSILLGSDRERSVSTGAILGGDLDEIAFHDRSLAPEEIRRVFEAGERGRCAMDLAVTSLVGTQFVEPGGEVAWTCEVRNLGGVRAQGWELIPYRGNQNIPMILPAEGITVDGQVASTRLASILLPDIEPGQSVQIAIRGQPELQLGPYPLEVYLWPPNGLWDTANRNDARSLLVVASASCLAAGAEPIAWLPLDERGTDLVTRRSLTLEGTIGRAPGVVGGGSRFDLGGSATVEVAPGSRPGLGFEAWVNPDGAVASREILMTYGTGNPGSAGFRLWLARSGVPEDRRTPWGPGRMLVGMAGSGAPTMAGDGWIDGGAELPSGVWSHVFIELQRGLVRVYLNGALTGERRWSTDPAQWDPGFLRLGSGVTAEPSVGTPFQGRMDEVMVFAGDHVAAAAVSGLAVGSVGRCPGDYWLRWDVESGGDPTSTVLESLKLAIENVGPVPMVNSTMVMPLPGSLVLDRLRSSRGTVEMTTWLGQPAVLWREPGVVEPGAMIEVSFQVLEARSEEVTLSPSVWATTPEGVKGNNTATRSFRVGPGNLSLAAATIPEGGTGTNVFLIEAKLARPLSREARVDAVIGPSARPTLRAATPNIDYLPGRQTLVFPAGVLTQWVRVEVYGDSWREGNEEFALRLENLEGLTVTGLTNRIVIQDDDPVPTAVLGSARIVEGDEGERVLRIPVTLTSPSEVPLQMEYRTTNRTAIAGLDYVATTGTVNFSPGMPGEINVPILGDRIAEEAEWFQIVGTIPLRFASELRPPLGVGVGIIEDDDGLTSIAALALDPLPATAVPGALVPVVVRSLDSARRPLAAAGEQVRMRWHRGPGRPCPVVFSEVIRNAEGAVELQSTLGRDLSLEGWKVVLYGPRHWPAPATVWVGARTNVLKPLGTLVIRQGTEPGLTPPVDWAVPINLPLSLPLAAALYDPAGNLIDLFTAGNATPAETWLSTAAEPAEWPGFEVGLRHLARMGRSYHRRGSLQSGSADDWFVARSTAGARNRSVLLPMSATSRPALDAGQIELQDGGIGRASVALPAEPGEWTLLAEASNGRTGIAGTISTRPPVGVGIAAFDVPARIIQGVAHPVPLRLVLTNQGNSTVSNVVARIGLSQWNDPDQPADQVFSTNWVARSSAGTVTIRGTNSPDGPNIEASLGNLEPGGSATVDVDGGLFSILSTVLWASVVGDGDESDPRDNIVTRFPDWTSSSPISQAPLAWWRLENDPRDVMGGMDILMGGNARFTQGPGLARVALDGTGYVELPTTLRGSLPAPVRERNLAIWFRTTSLDDGPDPVILLSRRNATASPGDFEITLVDGQLQGWAVPSIQQLSSFAPPGDLRDGDWHVLKVVFNNSVQTNVTFVLDGKPLWQTAPSPTFEAFAADIPIRVGGSPGRRGLRGQLADLIVFDDPLSLLTSLESRGPDTFRRARIETGVSALPWYTTNAPATQGRPFALKLNITNVGPLMSSNFVLTYPRRGDLQLLSVSGPVVREDLADGSVQLRMGPMQAGEVQRLDLIFRAEAPREEFVTPRWSGHPLNLGGGPSALAVIAPDTDGDGLYDSWERAMGLNPADPADATLDPDGDGLSSLSEYEAGTSPVDPGSVLALAMERHTDGTLALIFESKTGRRYELQRRWTESEDSPWELQSSAAGDGRTVRIEGIQTEGTGAWFRVRVQGDR